MLFATLGRWFSWQDWQVIWVLWAFPLASISAGCRSWHLTQSVSESPAASDRGRTAHKEKMATAAVTRATPNRELFRPAISLPPVFSQRLKWRILLRGAHR